MIATRTFASALALVACLVLAGPVAAATLKTLRVGQHPEFTRVVFELDQAAGYTVERRAGEDGTPLLIVRLDAKLAPEAPQRLQSRSALLESVTMTRQEQRSVATLRLRKSDLPVKEMILSSPARIVLDVVGADTALVQRPVRRAAAPPAPQKPPTQATPAPEPQQVAKPEPQQVAKPAQKPPEPQATAVAPPAPAAKPKPEPQKAIPSPKPPAPAQPEPAKPAPKTAVVDDAAEKTAREAMDKRLAAVREAAEKRQRQLQAEKEEQRRLEAERRKAEAAAKAAAEPPAPTAAPEPSQEGLPSPVLLAGAGVLALALVIGLVVMFRRRSLPKDVDASPFGAEPDFRAGFRAEPEPAQEESDEFQVGGTPEPLVGGGAAPPTPASGPGLFDEPEKGESEMESQVHVGTQPSPAAPASRGGSDVAQLVAELERRISQLESGLEEANASRERLERQVVAQSEELRVQRAAIARTQRALRGMSRSDEEQATEPALRE